MSYHSRLDAPAYTDQDFIAFIENDERFTFHRDSINGRVMAVCVTCGAEQFSRWGMTKGSHFSSCAHWTERFDNGTEWWKDATRER